VSLIVVIDVAGDSVIKPIELQRKNPYDMALFGEKLYVTCTGSWWDPTDGGIEVIDTATDINQGVLVSETELGGNLSGIAVVSASKGYVLVMGTWPNTLVKPFDPQTGIVEDALVGATSAIDAEFNGGGKLYVADRSTEHPGIYIYDTLDDTLIAGPISTGLPPNSIAFVEH
jgi:DNA-binding beta-propeller fold protein YncE